MARDKFASTLPISLALFDSVQNGGAFIRNITRNIGGTWKRSIRSIGGYWIGQAEWEGPAEEMSDIFANGLMQRVTEDMCGMTTWEGFIAEMELTLGKMRLYRSWEETANRIKAIYTKIGDNLLTDGSAESAAWDAYGTPTTREQSTAWVTHGSYSCHLVTNAKWEGAFIHQSGGVTLEAGKSYHFQVTIKVISGKWRVAIYILTNPGYVNYTTVLDYADVTVADDPQTIELQITDSNAITIGIALYTTALPGGECYADGAILQEAPVKAETSWYSNAQSIADYGTLELILSQPGMSAASAQAMAETELAKRAWPKTYPPRQLQDTGSKYADRAKLDIVVYGYVFGLSKRYAITDGTDAASDWVTNLLTGDDNITAGLIQANSYNYFVDAAAPLRVWDIMRGIALAGDASDNRWTLGVYDGRKLDYLQAETDIVAHLRSSIFWDSAGTQIDPWLARPGYVRIDDMPAVVGAPLTTTTDDQKIVYMEEVEFDAEEWLKSGRGLRYRMEAR